MWRVKRLLLRGGGTLEALLKPFLRTCNFRTKCYNDDVLHHNYKEVCMKKAFTLAEMMVVMLILSIVLAAMAPVVTTRSKVDQSSPWRYSEGNLSDAYYGLGESQTAMIGQREFTDTDETAKLIINSSSTRPSHIAFKRDGVNQGVLRLNNNSILLGNITAGSLPGEDAVSIGYLAEATGDYSTCVGRSCRASTTDTTALGNRSKADGDGATSLGYNSEASKNYSTALGSSAQATGDDSTAIGNSAQASGDLAVSIGYNSSAGTNNTAIGSNSEASGLNSTSIGQNSSSTGIHAIAIGRDTISSGQNSVTIGDVSEAQEDNSIAIGASSKAGSAGSIALGCSTSMKGSNSIGIGNSANSEVSNAVAIGTNATVLRGGGIAIGNNAYSGATNSTLYGDNAVAIGSGAKMGNDYGVAIGNNSGHTNKGTYGVAIGYNACQYVSGSNKVCIGANSGPKSGSDWSSDDTERIFIGSKSKFNDGAAVLEVHNNSGKIWDGNGKFVTADSTVVINGHLVVKGGIVSTLWRKGESNDDINLYGRTGGQLEPFDASGIISRYGPDDKGAFRSFNGNKFNTGSWGWSDKRLKYVGKENTSGLDKIRQLKVFNYTFKKDETKTPRVGVIAQDLQKVFPDAVKKGSDGFLIIRMEDIFFAVINAIKELDAKVAAQDKKIKELEARIEKLEARLN